MTNPRSLFTFGIGEFPPAALLAPLPGPELEAAVDAGTAGLQAPAVPPHGTPSLEVAP